MSAMENVAQIENILQEIDRLIAEMSLLRNQVAALSGSSPAAKRSVREAEYFGMWADREDMREQSSRVWLEQLRAQQWTRS
jgi:hypothetical protein